MRGSRAQRFLFSDGFQNGNRKSRAFNGIRAGTDLVEQDETAVFDGSEHLNDMDHMRGECRERLLNALLVSDIREDIVKNTHHGAVRNGDMHTRLCHNGKQAECFQGYRFTARIRSGNNECVKINAE